jgi:hypothetical protein
MWTGIAGFIQLLLIVAKWWFGLDDAKKAKAKELLKGVDNANDASSITRLFDDINRM